MDIAGIPIGSQHPPRTYIIAELSANHRGSLDDAYALVRAAADSGADAVKLQTYTPDTITLDVRNRHFMISAGTIWDGRTLHDLYAEAQTPWGWHEPLKRMAESHGMALFSSPFDPSSVDFLLELGVPAFKIASFELVDVGLVARVARTGKPLIMSTGMATLDEIAESLRVARSSGASDMALLKCTSAYPAPPEEANLLTIPHMAAAFRVPVGLSDHTIGPSVPIAAVAVGAMIIEKHLTLDRSGGGPDSKFSTEPDEFRRMVDGIRAAEKALGQVTYEPTATERESRRLRRSLFVVADMKAGDPFTTENIRSIRPSHGLHTRHLPDVLGRTAAIDIQKGTPLSWRLVSSEGLVEEA